MFTNMKLIPLILICCFLPFFAAAQAQNNLPDARLSTLFEADYLQRLQTLQPVQLQRLNYYLDHSYEVQTIAVDKEATDLPEVSITDLATFNIIAFERERGLYRSPNSIQVFRIKGTNKLLILLSESEFVKRFNAAR
jgi:hypothetical protein